MSTAGKGRFSGVVRQAHKMQQQIGRVQEEMYARMVEASSGGGRVTAYVNGRQELVNIKIDPEVIDPANPKQLEELVLEAVSQAIQNSQEMVKSEVDKITGGFNIPGLF